MATFLTPTTWAVLLGLLPSLLWLAFWRHLVQRGREPAGLVLTCFLLGAVSVLLATVIQQHVVVFATTPQGKIVILAAVEEVLKFLVFYLVAYHSAYDDDALDPAMYMIAVALGFAALENIFYILKPAASFNITASLLTGGLRFLGSTLLHAVASCFVGIVITLTPRLVKNVGIILGIAGAIFLHSTFNFFILKHDTASVIQIYGYLWIVAIISHVILEKFRRIPPVPVLTPQ